jgi:hypothetical protein
MIARILTTLLLVCSFTALPRTATASECGDLNGDCSITILDAFVLLGRALNFNYTLFCPYVEECSASASPSEVIGDCFGDPGCLDPDKPYCDDNVCSVCSRDEHCDADWSCDHKRYRCMPNCFYVPPATVSGHSDECGDMDDSGSISVSDALAVLRRSVGLSVQLRCPSSAACTTTTTDPAVQDCFSDDDCGWTGAEYCCANVCSECEDNEHCPEGYECDGNCFCIPIPQPGLAQ